MKKKIFTLVTLALAVCSGVWGAITPEYKDFSGLGNNVVYMKEHANITTTSSTAIYISQATEDKWLTSFSANAFVGDNISERYVANENPDDESSWSSKKLYCTRLKNHKSGEDQRTLKFYVTGITKVRCYMTESSSRTVNMDITPKNGKTTNYNSNTGPFNSGVLDSSKEYLVEIYGGGSDVYVHAVKFYGTSNNSPTITTQPTSATYESGETPSALTVAATASAGNLSYQWYSNTDGDTTGKDADKINGATTATLAAANISTASAGTTYYYCIVTDGNGSSTSNAAEIEVKNVIAPVISYASNTVTITCEGTGTVYYTTDNSEPTASSTAYTAPFALTNTSTVRAVAIKGEKASEIVFSNCYVDHSATALAVLGFGDGTHASGVWTSTDGNYKLTSSNKSEIQYYTIFNGSDGFKLNHTNAYTFKVSDNIKVTSIKFVGKSRGDAVNNSTIAFDGFTPESGTIEKGTFVKTIEFTPSSPLGYGASIEITTGRNQFGGYIEVYGEEYAKTVTTTSYETTTWDFTNWSDATIAGLKADTENWNPYEKADNGGLNFGENGRSLAIARSNNSLSYGDSGTKIAETDGLKFTCDAYGLGLIFNLPSATISNTEYTYQGSSYIWLYGNKSKINIENVTKGSIIEIGVESHNGSEARTISLNNATQTQGATSGDAAKAYQVCKWEVTTAGTITITPSKGLHIYYIKLDKAVETEAVAFTPVYDKTTFVTPKALNFTDVEGLKAYVATETNSNGVKISEVTAPVPAGTPLLLIGTADTEYTVPVAAATEATAPATNLLVAGDGTNEFDGTTYDYILGSDGKFHQIGSGTVATNKAYLHLGSKPAARSLVITFDDETDGISDTLKENEEMMTDKVFDLQGRRVANPTKGLYIVGGKKVIVK